MNQTAKQKIEIWERVTRADVRANRNKIFIFGDNLAMRGFGGQAKEMRGEQNAVGVPTKKAPDNKPESFFTDKELAANKQAIDRAFAQIPPDKIIVLPKAGIGTGLARLEEKAPQTFAYLNEKFADLGFDNRRGEKLANRANATNNSVVARNENEKTGAGEKLLLDLNNIKTAELKLLSPTTDEIAALEANRERALADYADRLRRDYKENKENLRDGFGRLSAALDKGGQITIACACRSGGMCHADVVRMAIEKVNAHAISGRESKSLEAAKEAGAPENSKTQSQNAKVQTNPRTRRAVNEILAASENDRILANINQTDGRNRSEQASFLGKSSQFARDIYERGATVNEGKLLVPQENLTAAAPLAVTTQEYAVKRIGKILRDESKAKEFAPTIVEYGEKISGLTADGETKLKVFAWIYDTLEGKNETPEQIESSAERFANRLEQIKSFAEEMHSLEPTDKIKFVPLAGEEAAQRESFFELADENRISEEIYENAIYGSENEPLEEIEYFTREADGGGERAQDFEPSGKAASEKYERIDLSENFPPVPEDFTEHETARLLSETLPEIDRQLENGVDVKEVLKPFNQNVWQSQKDDALNRLEAIYQKQQIVRLENKLVTAEFSAEQRENLENEISRWRLATLTPTRETLRGMLADRSENAGEEIKPDKREPTISQLGGKSDELSENAARQINDINIFRPNIIEIEMPAEFRLAEEKAIQTFFQKTKQEIASRLLRLDEIKTSGKISTEQAKEVALKKELNQIKELKPSFAFKLENSTETVVGAPSQKTIDERNFVSFYVNYQLKQPETRLRHENERYRIYAARLEAAATREAVIKAASEIRAENAALGMNWKNSEKSEKQNQPRPLTQKEMQFLFTETSPAHYTQAMTVARLAYAHAGASRRLMTESLLRGEISSSPEAQKLIESLESRLNRRNPTDAILATKHFFESIKMSNDALKYKNDFDHRDIYRKLPPQERDFVYERAVRQKENLEYRLIYRQQQLIQDKTNEKPRFDLSRAEKSFHLTSLFHQARILGDRIESIELKSKEISESDFRTALVLLNNHSGERVGMIGDELKNSVNVETQKVGEILRTFAKAEISKVENKTQVKITLPENRLVSTDAYRELLEKLYPNDARENDKYKFSSLNERAVEDARTKGQDTSLAISGEELKRNVYEASAAPPKVFSIEHSIAEDFSKVGEMQREARDAQRENQAILTKYAARAATKIQIQTSLAQSSKEQKSIVRAALSAETGEVKLAQEKTREQFFQAVQKEITVSDFQKFASNEKLIGENLSGIKNQFSEISVKRIVLEKNKFQPEETRFADKLQSSLVGDAQQFEENRLLTETARALFESDKTPDLETKTIADLIGETERSEIKTESFALAQTQLGTDSKTAQTEQTESKPFSLRLYEAEIARAEKELRTKNFGAKILAGLDYSESELSVNLDKIFSAPERESLKVEAAEIAKSRLEPKELDADHRKISIEASRQAISTFKQLEQAHNVFQLSGDNAKINEAFSKLDHEAAALNQIRLDYSRAERLAVLRETVKTDIADLLRKNPDLKGNALAEQTGKILAENLTHVGGEAVLTDTKKEKITELSRVICEKIESNQSKTSVAKQIGQQYSQSENKELKPEFPTPRNDRSEKQPFVFAR